MTYRLAFPCAMIGPFQLREEQRWIRPCMNVWHSVLLFIVLWLVIWGQWRAVCNWFVIFTRWRSVLALLVLWLDNWGLKWGTWDWFTVFTGGVTSWLKKKHTVVRWGTGEEGCERSACNHAESAYNALPRTVRIDFKYGVIYQSAVGSKIAVQSKPFVTLS